MRKPWLLCGAAALGALALAAVVASRIKAADDAGGAAVTLEFVPAEVVRPQWQPLPQRLEFSGPLVAPRTALVRAKAAGTLLSLTVGEGSRVRAGQVLGTIDLSDLQSHVAERAAGVESAQARLDEAQRTYRSNEDLAAQRFISANALASSRAALDSARAQLKVAQAQLSTSTLGVRSAALTAPIGGVVGKRSVVPGERVSAEQELLTVVDLSTLELAGVVGTHQVALLHPGQAVAVTVEGAPAPMPARIDRIAPSAEPGTRGIRVVVALANPGDVLRAGQYASAQVTLDDGVRRLTLPTAAVAQASGQDFVWTLERGALVRRIVTTGRRDGARGQVEVVHGVDDAAVVIAVPFDTLKEGAPARVVAPGAGAASAARVGAG